MFRRKSNPESTENARELAIKPGKGGIVPPREHQFKSGGEWKGNKTGRPRILLEESAAYLREIDPATGKTRARIMIEATASLAEKVNPMAPAVTYGALKAIREVAEPTEAEQIGTLTDKAFIRSLAELLLERKANVTEIN